MINAQLLRDKGILVVSPVDKLQTADFEQLRLLADPYIEKHGGLNGLLIDVESFPGWEDFASMLSHISFLNNYEKKIERVATVTDNGFSRHSAEDRGLLRCCRGPAFRIPGPRPGAELGANYGVNLRSNSDRNTGANDK